MKPKDWDPILKKHGTIYKYQCGELMCNKEYIGETSSTLGERYKEHLKEPSTIHAHSTQTGHNNTPDNFNIMGREDHGLPRTIKESFTLAQTIPHLIGILVSTILIIYWTEPYFTPPPEN